MPQIFNDYDEQGYRTSAAGCRTSKTADNALLANLRFKYAERIETVSDQQVVNTYDMYAISEDFGDDDLWFEHWLDMDI